MDSQVYSGHIVRALGQTVRAQQLAGVAASMPSLLPDASNREALNRIRHELIDAAVWAQSATNNLVAAAELLAESLNGEPNKEPKK